MVGSFDFSQSILQGYWQQAVAGNPQILPYDSARLDSFSRLVSGLSQWVEDPVGFYAVRIRADGSQRQAYFPLLSIILAELQVQQLDVASLLQQADVYLPHRPLLTACLTAKTPVEREDIILSELEFEQRQMRRSLRQILEVLSRHRPLVLVLAELQHAGASLWNWFSELDQAKGRLLILCSFDSGFRHLKDEQHLAFNQLVSDLNLRYSVQVLLQSGISEPWPVADKLPVVAAGEAWLEALLSFDELNQLAQQHLELDKDELSAESQRHWLNVAANSCMYLGLYDQSLIYLDKLAEQVQVLENWVELSEIKRRMALVHLKCHLQQEAQRLALQSLKLAEQMQDIVQQFRACFVLYQIADAYTTPISDGHYQRLLELLSILQMENHRAYCYRNCYMYHRYYERELSYAASLNRYQSLCELALAIYQQLGNLHGAAQAYHYLSIVCSLRNDLAGNLDCLQRSAALKEQIGDRLGVLGIANGLGYSAMQQGDYVLAREHFCRAMEQLPLINDYGELGSTLFNLGFLYLHDRQFQQAAELFDVIAQVMLILDMNHIPYHSLDEVLIMRCWCQIQLGQTLRAMQIVSRLKGDYSNSQTAFFYELMQALLLQRMNQPEMAERHFKQSRQALNLNILSDKGFLPCFWLEFGRFCKEWDDQERATEAFEQGLIEAEALGLKLYAYRLRQELSQPEKFPHQALLPALTLDVGLFLSNARHDVRIGRLQKRIRQIHFLQQVQEQVGQANNRILIGDKLLALIGAHFPVGSMYLFVQEDSRWHCLTQLITEAAIGFEPLAALRAELHKTHPVSFEWPALQPKVRVLVLPLCPAGKPVAHLLLARSITEPFINQEESDVLAIAATQVMTAFDKIDRETSLVRISQTDVLTGLANRSGLQRRLMEEVARMQRYRQGQPQLSLAFLDLDNFKYYNDTFGHQAGDLIIQQFARLLQHTVRETDFVARFGGDEFVVIFCETEGESSLIAGHRLLSSLQKCQGFQKELSTLLQVPVEIPTAKWLGCSVGIAGWHEAGRNVNEQVDWLLSAADKALYQAKSSGKNRVTKFVLDAEPAAVINTTELIQVAAPRDPATGTGPNA